MAARSFTLPPGFRYSELGGNLRRARGNQSLQLKDRSLAHQLGDVIGDAQVDFFQRFLGHTIRVRKRRAERQLRGRNAAERGTESGTTRGAEKLIAARSVFLPCEVAAAACLTVCSLP